MRAVNHCFRGYDLARGSAETINHTYIFKVCHNQQTWQKNLKLTRWTWNKFLHYEIIFLIYSLNSGYFIMQVLMQALLLLLKEETPQNSLWPGEMFFVNKSSTLGYIIFFIIMLIILIHLFKSYCRTSMATIKEMVIFKIFYKVENRIQLRHSSSTLF